MNLPAAVMFANKLVARRGLAKRRVVVSLPEVTESRTR